MTVESYNESRVPVYAPQGFPDWLLAPDVTDDKFTEFVKDTQNDLGVTIDGYCGPSTIEAIGEKDLKEKADTCPSNLMIVGPKAYEVSPTQGVINYVDDPSIGDTDFRDRKATPYQIVAHYDVSYSARATENILENRGYSTHFIIDGDEHGTIFQCHNPATRVAFHAGSANENSIGIDLNNPAATKYLEGDKQRRGRAREIIKEEVHGYEVERLSYFPEQIEAFRRLLDYLLAIFDIPEEYPTDENGDPVIGRYEDSLDFKGVIGHYHLTEDKTDPSPLNWEEVF